MNDAAHSQFGGMSLAALELEAERVFDERDPSWVLREECVCDICRAARLLAVAEVPHG